MIQFFNLKKEPEELNTRIAKKLKNIIKNKWFILGEQLNKFEKEFSSYIGTKYGIGVNSGSDALYLALKSIGVGKNDEIITVSHSFISTADAIIRNNAKPIFIDIKEDNYCIDPSLIEEKITKKTKAIIPVHLYGHPADMGPIIQIAEDNSLYVIEDACQAHGAKYKNKKVGSIGDIGCFSFYPTKNLGSYGDGGIALSNNEELIEKMRMLRNYGQKEKYNHEFIGVNSRLEEIQAGILREKLKYLDGWNNNRRKIATLYYKQLKDLNLIIPTEKEYARHVYHLYVIRHIKRDFLKNYLNEKGIQTQIHYPVPIHLQKAYVDFNLTKLTITEKICNEILSLPMHPWLEREEILKITEVIENAFS